MKKPARSCKVIVSPGIYADWLCAEQGLERGPAGEAIQRFALVREYTATRGGQGQRRGERIIGIYEPRGG